MLQDGAGSTRQLVDEEGAVNLSVSYTPWGDTMEVYGSGMLNLGYLGGVYDVGTGLIYIGSGQYYDPRTGRFLTRGAQPEQNNPYTPWNTDPAGMLIAPLAILALVFGRKKNKTRFDQFVIGIVLILSIGFALTPGRVAFASDNLMASSALTSPPSTRSYYSGSTTRNVVQTPKNYVIQLPGISDCDRDLSMYFDKKYDPKEEPVEYVSGWDPGMDIDLAPGLPKDTQNAQSYPYYKYQNGESVFSGWNLCGWAAVSMIYSTYYDGEDILGYLAQDVIRYEGQGLYSYDILQMAISSFEHRRPLMKEYSSAGSIFNSIYRDMEWTGGAYFNSDKYEMSSGMAKYTTGTRESNTAVTANALNQMLRNQANLMFMVTIEKHDVDGKLWPRESHGVVMDVPIDAVNHWVVVTGMSSNWNYTNEDADENWIRINNPHNNRVEYYKWNDFQQSLGALQSGFQYVELYLQESIVWGY